MGFDVNNAKKALKDTDNNLEMSIDKLSRQATATIIKDAPVELPPTNNPLIKLLIYISDRLEAATQFCFMCLKPLGADSIKLRTCHNPTCEFSFEEAFGGKVYSELYYSPEESTFDLSLAVASALSSRNMQVFEPFPTFFLKHNELREKRGFLDNVKKVKDRGLDVGKA